MNYYANNETFYGEDRRIRGERVDVHFPVMVTQQGTPIQGDVLALNLSWSGMLLATNFPLNLNDQINLEFRLPNNDVPIGLTAKVIHQKNGKKMEDPTFVGVAFIKVEPNIQRMLMGYVLENLSVA